MYGFRIVTEYALSSDLLKSIFPFFVNIIQINTTGHSPLLLKLITRFFMQSPLKKNLNYSILYNIYPWIPVQLTSGAHVKLRWTETGPLAEPSTGRGPVNLVQWLIPSCCYCLQCLIGCVLRTAENSYFKNLADPLYQ